jgi:hypothetical protein
MNKKRLNETSDPLLEFFLKLLDDKKEKEIISLIFEGIDKNKIIEKLIKYKAGNRSDD